MGFAALLLTAGLLTLGSGVFARWTGVVALIGAAGFLVAFAAVLSGLGEDSLFGFGFFPGVLALVIWSIATSIARYRALATASPARLARLLLKLVLVALVLVDAPLNQGASVDHD